MGHRPAGDTSATGEPDHASTGRSALSRAATALASTVVRPLATFDRRRLLVVALFLAIFSFDLGRPTDIDFWWHLKTGDLIASTGAVPAADPFSYTVAGRPWVVHEWLWDLALSELYRLGTHRLAVLVSALVVVATYAILYRLLRRLGANQFAAAILVVWAAALALPSSGVRPRELTHLFFALYLSLLWRHRSGGRTRWLWVLPAVMVVWVNVHGPFILGLALVGLFLVGEALEWRLAGGRPPRELALVSLVTLLATVVNPLGPRMLLYPFGYYLGGENPSFSRVTEFQSPSFHDPLYLAFATGPMLLMALPPRGRRRLADGLLLAAFTAQALVSLRHVPIAALVAAPIIADRLVAAFRLVGELPEIRSSSRHAAANWVILAAMVAIGVLYASQPAISGRLQLGPTPSTRDVPVAGARFVEEHALPDPVFNEQTWGGYLIYRWYPARRVFVDGRVDMYGAALVDEYLKVVTVRPGWDAVLDRHGVQTMLIPKDSALSVLLLADGRWERVFQGELEDVFVRK